MSVPNLRQKGRAYYYDHGGKPRRWEPLGSDKAKALLRWAEIRGGGSDGRTVGGLIKLFMSKKTGLADNTLKSYRKSAAIINRYFEKCPLDALDQGHMNQLIDEYPKKQMARNAALFFKTVLAWAVSRGHIRYSPLTGMRLEGQSRRDRYLTDGEFTAVRNELQPQFQIAADLAYLMGLRVSGVVAIKHSDIKDGVLTFHPRKSKKPISYQINAEVQAVIDRAKALPGAIRGFTIIHTRTGQPYAANSVSQAFKEAANRAGIPNARFHDIRAKSASDDESTAQKRLGHRRAETTQIYLRKPQVVTPIKGIT